MHIRKQERLLLPNLTFVTVQQDPTSRVGEASPNTGALTSLSHELDGATSQVRCLPLMSPPLTPFLQHLQF